MTCYGLRISVGLLLTALVVPAGAAAQGPGRTDGQDFAMFVRSVSMRRNARVCERSLPGYGKTFTALYGAWSQTHRAEIARGEAIYTNAAASSDLAKYPYTNPTTIARTRNALAELAKPAPPSGSSAVDPRTTAACDKVLESLKAD